MYLMSEFQRGMAAGAAIYLLTASVCAAGWVYVLGRVLNYFKIKKNGRYVTAASAGTVNGHIKVEFEAEDGQKITHTSRSNGFDDKKYPNGTEIGVYYDPASPGTNIVLKGHDVYEHITAFVMATVILLPFAIMLVNAAAYSIIQYLGYK